MESDITNSLLKLSYPSHKTVPSIIASLMLSVDEKYGRHIITSSNLATGDIIAIVKPFYKSLDKSEVPSRCVNCFKEATFISCSTCSSVKFCSVECQGTAWEEFHKFECSSIDEMTDDDGFLMMIERSLFKAIKVFGNVAELRNFLGSNRSSLTVFDIDFDSEDLEKSLLLACDSLEKALPTPRERVLVDQLVHHHKNLRLLWQTFEERVFLTKFILKFIGIMYRNSFTLHWKSDGVQEEEIGCAIIPFASLLNHSCSPNLYRFCVDDNVVFVARRPIEVNEQLFISYQHQFYQSSRDERQRSLQRQFNFLCTCEACLNDYPLSRDLESFDKDFLCLDQFSSPDEAKKLLLENCRYMNIHFEKFPVYELIRVMQVNYKILQYLFCYNQNS